MSDRSQDRPDPSLNTPPEESAHAEPGAEPRKAHGDGLLEGNGSRQGEDPGKRTSEDRGPGSSASDSAEH